MRRRSTTSLVPVTAFLLLSFSLMSCSPAETPPPASGCDAIRNYVPSSTAALSFATDIYPILSVTTQTVGCSQTTICHGTPPRDLVDNDAGAVLRTLSFVDPPATVKAALLTASLNAPSMPNVVAGNVGGSFMAYKISGTAGLACANSMCVANSSVGASQPCGDIMPTGGVLTPADRTKILDWIANGAAN